MSPATTPSGALTNPTTTPTLTISPPPSEVADQWQRVDDATLSSLASLQRLANVHGSVFALGHGCADSECATRLLTTADGEAWTLLEQLGDVGGAVSDFGALPDGFVAVGTAPSPSHSVQAAAIWTFGVGNAWSPVGPQSLFTVGADGGPGNENLEIVISSVTQGPLGYLAGGAVRCLECFVTPGSGSRYVAWLSTDGSNWTRQPWQAGGPEALYRLAADDKRYVGTDGHAVWTSTDGETWSRAMAIDPETSSLDDVGAGGGRYLAVGTDPQQLAFWRSQDGVSWQRVDGLPSVSAATPERVEWVAGEWAVIGADSVVPHTPHVPTIWLSADGLSWQRQVITDDEYAQAYDVAAVGGRLVVIGFVGVGGPVGTGTAAAWIGPSLP
jgi:hypothetical protein